MVCYFCLMSIEFYWILFLNWYTLFFLLLVNDWVHWQADREHNLKHKNLILLVFVLMSFTDWLVQKMKTKNAVYPAWYFHLTSFQAGEWTGTSVGGAGRLVGWGRAEEALLWWAQKRAGQGARNTGYVEYNGFQIGEVTRYALHHSWSCQLYPKPEDPLFNTPQPATGKTLS